jgi:hypothetical protein
VIKRPVLHSGSKITVGFKDPLYQEVFA